MEAKKAWDAREEAARKVAQQSLVQHGFALLCSQCSRSSHHLLRCKTLPHECSYDDYNPSAALLCKPLFFDCRICHRSPTPAFSTMFIPFSSFITSHCLIKRSKATEKHRFLSLSRFCNGGRLRPPQSPRSHFTKHIRASICHHLAHQVFFTNFLFRSF